MKYVALAIWFLLAVSLAAALPLDSGKTFERTVAKVAEGIYTIRHKDAPDTFPQGNTTVIIGDREVLVVKQHAALRRLPFAHVERALVPDHLPWHEQADRSVDRPTVPGDLRVGVLGPDFVAEEVRRPGRQRPS